MVEVEVTGVLVLDRNGLILASKSRCLHGGTFRYLDECVLPLGKDAPISPGPIARLAELATLLSGRRMTVCLEHQEK